MLSSSDISPLPQGSYRVVASVRNGTKADLVPGLTGAPVIPLAVSDGQARASCPDGWKTLKPHLRLVAQWKG